MSKNLAYGFSLYYEMCTALVPKSCHNSPLPKSETEDQV